MTGITRFPVALLFSIVLAVILSPSSQTAHANGWTRSLPIGEVGVNERKGFEPLVLGVWSGDDEHHVHGLCTYYNITSALFTIEGIETSDGDFYPQVLSQVSDKKEGGHWKTIKESISRSGKPTKLAVEPQSPSKTLKVDLDAFLPFVGQRKYGRLLLKTGESAVFQIDDLQPPEKKTESSADAVKVER